MTEEFCPYYDESKLPTKLQLYKLMTDTHLISVAPLGPGKGCQKDKEDPTGIGNR